MKEISILQINHKEKASKNNKISSGKVYKKKWYLKDKLMIVWQDHKALNPKIIIVIRVG